MISYCIIDLIGSRLSQKFYIVVYSFLGTVDKLGAAYSDSYIATGFGNYLAIPLMKKNKTKMQEMNKEQAQAFMHKLMEVLYYRDARSFPKVKHSTNGVKKNHTFECIIHSFFCFSINGES